MKKQKLFSLISLGLNLTNIILVTISIVAFFVPVGTWQTVNYQQASCFRYFTIDSNIFMAITCAILIPYNIISIKKGEYAVPRWAMLLKLCGTVTVVITMITVVVFLGPTQGFEYMYFENQLTLHLICPIIAVVSFLFFDSNILLKPWLSGLFALIPVSIYGNLYMIMVIGLTESKGGWPDFYGFNRGGFWPLTVVCMCAGTILLGAGICGLRNKVLKNKKGS